ncbi:MAG: hypothetical protein ACOC44_02540 [Promethearchaeia archaeon]
MIEIFSYGFLEDFVNFYAFIVLLLMDLILARRLFKEREQLGQFNIIRLLIFCAFLSFTWLLFWELIYESTPFFQNIPGDILVSNSTFSLYSIGVGMMVTIGLVIVAYGNQWESLLYAPFFFYGGMIIIYIFTGFDALLFPYIYFSAAVAAIFMILTGLRLKDNGSLGLAIFLLISLIALMFEGSYLGIIINFIYPSFGLYFSLGFFTPFKQDKGADMQ